MATTYQVKLTTTGHEIIGLPSDSYRSVPDPSTLLVYRYESGDIDTRMRNAEMMLGALYDTYQCHSGLHEGDRFETEFGTFECVSFHVVPADYPTTQAVLACENQGLTQDAANKADREACLDWQGDCQD